MALIGSFTGSILDGNYTLRVSWSATQNVAANTSRILCDLFLVQASSWDLNIAGRADNSVTVNGSRYVWPSAAINSSGGTTTKLATITTSDIAHNSDGTKTVTISATFNIRATISGTYYESITASASITLDRIARATQPGLSASAADMGASITISLPRADDNFTHDLAYSFAGGAYVSIATGVGTSQSWTVPDVASSIPNAASGTLTVRAITKSGSTTIGTKYAVMTARVPASVLPTVGTVSAVEATAGLASRFGAFVQNKSAINVSISGTGAKGSTIKEYQATLLGKAYSGSSWTSDVLSSSGTLSVKVKDSRGRWSAAKNVSITVLPYSPPAISAFRVYRVDTAGNAAEDGERLAVVYKYSVASLDSKNTASMKLEYKRSTATTWAQLLTGSAISEDTTVKPATAFSTDYRFDVRITVTDYFGASATYQATLPSGAVILDLRADGTGIAFGKTAERSGVDFGFDPKGRVLGLGAASEAIESGADLNEYKRIGVYSIRSNVVAAGVINIPLATAGTLRVFNATGVGTDAENAATDEWVYLMQEFYALEATRPVYRRTLSKNGAAGWSYGAWVVTPTMLSVYPLGSIYLSVNSVNPGELFGGTWERIQDVFLLASGNTYDAGSTGGEREHKLTVNEMPSHQHTLANGNAAGPTYDWTPAAVQLNGENGWTWNANTHPVGGGAAHNNMPPYLAVYVWKRTA